MKSFLLIVALICSSVALYLYTKDTAPTPVAPAALAAFLDVTSPCAPPPATVREHITGKLCKGKRWVQTENTVQCCPQEIAYNGTCGTIYYQDKSGRADGCLWQKELNKHVFTTDSSKCSDTANGVRCSAFLMQGCSMAPGIWSSSGVDLRLPNWYWDSSSGESKFTQIDDPNALKALATKFNSPTPQVGNVFYYYMSNGIFNPIVKCGTASPTPSPTPPPPPWSFITPELYFYLKTSVYLPEQPDINQVTINNEGPYNFKWVNCCGLNKDAVYSRSCAASLYKQIPNGLKTYFKRGWELNEIVSESDCKNAYTYFKTSNQALASYYGKSTSESYPNGCFSWKTNRLYLQPTDRCPGQYSCHRDDMKCFCAPRQPPPLNGKCAGGEYGRRFECIDDWKLTPSWYSGTEWVSKVTPYCCYGTDDPHCADKCPEPTPTETPCKDRGAFCSESSECCCGRTCSQPVVTPGTDPGSKTCG